MVKCYKNTNPKSALIR